jgi:poly-gamma-glutamate capsule biosynthesis protein CapA/YwtB (metallophosphatase superfamily)
MNDPTSDKPYRTYRAGDGGEPSPPPPVSDAAPDPPDGHGDTVSVPEAEKTSVAPAHTSVRRGTRAARRQRRRRVLGRRLVAAALFVTVCAVVVGVAVAWPFGALPTQGSGTAEAEPPAGAAASASPAASPSPQATLLVAQPEPLSLVDPAEQGFTISAGGDVLGDRSIRDVMDAHGPAGPFRKVTSYFAASDFGLVNLETPLTDEGSPQTWKDVVFKGDPRLAKGLSEAGINVVTLANNHAMDQGASGLLDTMKWLRKSDVAACGAGRDLADAYAPRVLDADGVEVAFLGFTDVVPAGYPATASNPGTTPGRSDVAAMKRAVAKAAKHSDYVVVSWHWNFEFTNAPSALELTEGKAAIDAGADLVLAHHPHVLQGIQTYHGGLIAYSLGDLVFDHCSGPMAETVIIKAEVNAKRIEVKLIPTALAYDGTPTRARGAQAASILGRVKSYSATLGTKVVIRDGLGYIAVKR